MHMIAELQFTIQIRLDNDEVVTIQSPVLEGNGKSTLLDAANAVSKNSFVVLKNMYDCEQAAMHSDFKQQYLYRKYREEI